MYFTQLQNTGFGRLSIFYNITVKELTCDIDYYYVMQGTYYIYTGEHTRNHTLLITVS